MTTTTSRDLGAPARRAALDHDLAVRLAAAEYARLLDQLRSLAPQDWSRPTSCSEWDVRAMVSHVLGMAEMSASLRQQVHQMGTAGRAGGVFIDALTALQVDERRHLTPTQIVQRLTEVAPRAVRGRRRTPALLRRCTLPQDQTVSGQPLTPPEPWTIGFLIDVILTRDVWMHRTDVADATGAVMELSRARRCPGRRRRPGVGLPARSTVPVGADRPGRGRGPGRPAVRTWSTTPSRSAGRWPAGPRPRAVRHTRAVLAGAHLPTGAVHAEGRPSRGRTALRVCYELG